jgi:hypothetical protein
MASQVRNLKNKPSDPYTEVFEIWKRASDAERAEIVELIRRLAAKLPKEDLDRGGGVAQKMSAATRASIAPSR